MRTVERGTWGKRLLFESTSAPANRFVVHGGSVWTDDEDELVGQWWNNGEGWVSELEYATRYSYIEKERFSLPFPPEGSNRDSSQWVEVITTTVVWGQ